MDTVRPTEAALKEFGAIGSVIPGSKYVRAYCTACAEPIRVVEGAECIMPRCTQHALTQEEELIILAEREEQDLNGY